MANLPLQRCFPWNRRLDWDRDMLIAPAQRALIMLNLLQESAERFDQAIVDCDWCWAIASAASRRRFKSVDGKFLSSLALIPAGACRLRA